ncbi:MAG TPA: phytoene desaturase family protein [Bacteroidales bacterium]|nr:phytoene desaturase family protein [Bacteroidales bacterium]
MNKSVTAIIAGAGIGGITTALYLARNGYRVEVFEKNDFPGGRCGQLVRNGYRFDMGATMMLMPEVYREVFRSLGMELDKELEVTAMNDLYTLFFDNGTRLTFTTDAARMAEQLEKFEKGSSVREREYVRKGYELYKFGFLKLLSRNFYRLTDFINLHNVFLLLKLKTYISHSRYTKRFFRDRRLQTAYIFQNIYVGQSPFSSPALFSMIPAAELTEGSLFPTGGMFSVVARLIEKCKAAGVRFHYGKEIKRIMVSGNRALGFEFNDGTTKEADVIIANADLPYVYNNLLPPSFKSWKLRHMKYSCSALVFHWGVDKAYPQLGHHSIFLSDDFRKGLNSIFRKRSIGNDPCFYVHAPVRTDPTAAPPGCDSLSIIVSAGQYRERDAHNWNAVVESTRRVVIEKLKRAGLTDIEKHIRMEMACTPVEWESMLNVMRGSVFGSLRHSILQMGYFRPHNRDNKYKNLYFTGGSTHPGNGIPMVLLSAKLVTERILRDYKK